MAKFRQLKTGGGNYVKWDTPKTVTGRLVGFQKGTYKGKNTMTILLAQPDGTQIKVSGSANIENSGLYNEQPGVMVEFVFKGKGKTKSGQDFNDIDVFVDSPEPDPSARPTIPPAVELPVVVVSTGTASEYDMLIAKLRLLNPKGAAAMEQALQELYPDVLIRIAKLRETLTQQGVIA